MTGQGDWPAWARQEVAISGYDPAWRDLAARLVADLDTRLAPWLEGGVEHVGSTAVPGLPAKPVVDLMGPVASLARAAGAGALLAGAGWHVVPPDLDARPWRRFYVLPEGDRRLAHLQLVERAHERWRDTLAFRDALRADPGLAAAYAEVKCRAAAAHPDDREAYTAAKSAFVARVVRAPRDPC